LRHREILRERVREGDGEAVMQTTRETRPRERDAVRQFFE